MAKTQMTREKRKWKQITALLFVAMAVCMMGYAILLSSIFESFVGKAKCDYKVTDTSITIELEDYKYAIIRGYIQDDSAKDKINMFYYPTQSNMVLLEDLLKAEGASMDADINFAQTIIISNWKHPWLHELIFVLGVLFIFVIPIPFCKAISRIDDKFKNVEN